MRDSGNIKRFATIFKTFRNVGHAKPKNNEVSVQKVPISCCGIMIDSPAYYYQAIILLFDNYGKSI